MVLVLTFLNIEARRFRFFDVWRARVRMLEENFMGPILRRDLESPVGSWGKLVAEDLLHPRFKLTYHQALRARLQRNYLSIFLLLLASWIIKLVMHPQNPDNPGILDRENSPVGGIVQAEPPLDGPAQLSSVEVHQGLDVFHPGKRFALKLGEAFPLTGIFAFH